MIETLRLNDTKRGLLLAAGLLLGVAVALATAGRSWQAGAYGLGLGRAAQRGSAPTCSA
jgi:hypothetical protein